MRKEKWCDVDGQLYDTPIYSQKELKQMSKADLAYWAHHYKMAFLGIIRAVKGRR